MIAYMDTIAGVYFPRGRDGRPGGVRALPQAYADAAVDAGVELRLGTEVTGLERQRRTGSPPSSPPRRAGTGRATTGASRPTPSS